MPGLSQAYEIVNVNSGKALDVSGSSTTDGAPVVQYTYHDGTNQQWYFKLIGTVNNQETYEIVNMNSGQVLDVTGGSTADGTPVEQWANNGGPNQQWFLNPVGLINWMECYQIISVNSNKALSVANSSVEDNAAIQQWTTTNATSQQWFLYPVGNVDQSPQLSIETKYMQNYRASSPVNGSNEIAAICDTQGQTELFTIGSDGNITVFSANPSSETGYTGMPLSTNLKAVSLAAGLDSQGQPIVFAIVEPGPQLYFIAKTASSTSTTATWGQPQPYYSFADPKGTKDAERIFVRNIAGSLYVGLLWSMSDSPYYKLTYTIWQGQESTFVSPADDPNFATLDGFWLGNSAQNAVFANFSPGKIYLHSIAAGQTTYATTTPDMNIVSIDATADAAGNDLVFAILDDKNAYQLSLPATGTGSNPAYTWGQCSQGIAFQQIATEVNSQGQPQIFAVSVPMAVPDSGTNVLFNVLYHWNNAYAPMPASIAKSTGMYLGTVGNDQGDVDLFTVDSQNHVTHLYQEQESENWTIETVEVSTGPIEEFCSYSTDITVYDSAGALAIGSPVTIWASEEARITVNGETFFIDPNHAGQIATNSAGMVSITQEATALAIPSLQINFSQFMQPGESVVIQQYAGVQSRLATVTGDDLMNATVADGSYLLSDEYRTPDNTLAMAQALNQCMGLVGEPMLATTSSSYLRKKGRKHGVWLRPSGSAADLRKLAHKKHKHSWQLSLKGNVAHYKELTAHQARALMAKEKANPQLGGAFDWIDDVGDFFEGVVDEVIDVTNIIVTAVEGGVEAVISFVMNNVPYVFDAVITVIEQAFDLAQTIFAAFLVPYELLFQWLAELFGWNDILRTKQALAYTINQCLGFFKGAAPGLQTFLDSNMGQLQGQLTALFNYADQNIAGQSTIGGYEQANDVVNVVLNYAFSNNFLYNQLMDYLTSALGSLTLSNNSALNQISQLFINFANMLEGTSAYTDAVSFFRILGSDPDQIFTQLLSTLFQIAEEFLQAGLSGVRALVDAVFQTMSTIVANLQSVFNTPWDIPFVSEFYSFITEGSQLTTLDLICLLMAIPINSYYQLSGWGDAPFTDDASLSAFESAFNSQTMVQTSGLMSQGTLQASSSSSNQPAIPLSQQQRQFVVTGYAVGTILNGLLSSQLDKIPSSQESTPWTDLLNVINYITMFGAFACRYEGFFTEADLNLLESAAVANTSYYVAGAVIMAVGAVALAWHFYPPSDATRTKLSDAKALLFTFGGCANLALSIVMAIESDESAEQTSWRVLQPIPWIAKCLRLSCIQGPATLETLEGIDILFNSAVAELGYWSLT